MRNRLWLLASAVLALVYLCYILWAKFAKLIGPPPLKLGEVGEFWLFFAAIAAFTLQVITAERAGSLHANATDRHS